MASTQLFKCPECGLHYHDKETAEECEKFCAKNHACNFLLIQKSVEHQKAGKHEG